MVLYRLTGNKISVVAVLDCSAEDVEEKYALSCLGRFGTKILWVGLSAGENGVAHIYDFDVETKEIRELEEKRVEHGEYRPLNVYRVGNQFYYSGEKGKINKLTYSI